MDILIKNMEMPSCCEECPFMKKVCDIYFTDKKTGVKTPYHYVDSCSLTGSWFDPFSDDSPKPCPLIPVPEHGDLIDRDAVLKEYNQVGYMWQEVPRIAHEELVHIVYNAPVVLERTT